MTITAAALITALGDWDPPEAGPRPEPLAPATPSAPTHAAEQSATPAQPEKAPAAALNGNQPKV
jgi:hypothetical protein